MSARQEMTMAEYRAEMAKQAKPSKYHARWTEGIGPNGETVNYASKAEADYAFGLHAQKLSGQILDWKPQHRIPITHGSEVLCLYVADFLVTRLDGSKEILEVKGYQRDGDPVTRLWRLKVRLLEVFWLPKHLDTTFRLVET